LNQIFGSLGWGNGKAQKERNEGGGVRVNNHKREAVSPSLTSVPGGNGDSISSNCLELIWLS